MIKKGYKLFLYNGITSDSLILLSEFTSNNDNTLIFNETFTEEENSKYMLSFSIASNLNLINTLPENFDFLKYLRIGRKLLLELYNNENDTIPYKKIDFIITSIAPVGSSKNIVWEVTSQDYASVVFSKNNVELALNTFEDEEWLDWIEEKTLEYEDDLRVRDLSWTQLGFLSFSRWRWDLVNFYNELVIEKDDVEYNYWPYNEREAYNEENSSIEWTVLSSHVLELFEDDIKKLEVEVDSGDTLKIQYIGKPSSWVESLSIYKNGSTTSLGGYSFSFQNRYVKISFRYVPVPPEELDPNYTSYFYLKNKKVGVAKDLINFVLRKGHLQNEITGEDELITEGWVSLESTDLDSPLNTKINLDLTASNTYNALVEIALLTNSLLYFDYYEKEINLISRDSDGFRKGFLLTPEFNLQDLSLNYNNEEFYPILYVGGGEDENGLTVGLVPYLTYEQYSLILAYINDNSSLSIDSNESDFYTGILASTEISEEALTVINNIPYLDNFILNLDYFVSNYLLTESEKNDIEDKIYNDLRKINTKYQLLIYLKNLLYSAILKKENQIDAIVEEVASNIEEDYSVNESKLNRLFLEEGGSNFAEGFESLEIAGVDSNFADSSITIFDLMQEGYYFYEIDVSIYNQFEALGSESWDGTSSPLNSSGIIYYDGINFEWYVSSNFTKQYPISIDISGSSSSHPGIIDTYEFTTPNQEYRFDNKILSGYDEDEFSNLPTYEYRVSNERILNDSNINVQYAPNGNNSIVVEKKQYLKNWVDFSSQIVTQNSHILYNEDGSIKFNNSDETYKWKEYSGPLIDLDSTSSPVAATKWIRGEQTYLNSRNYSGRQFTNYSSNYVWYDDAGYTLSNAEHIKMDEFKINTHGRFVAINDRGQVSRISWLDGTTYKLLCNLKLITEGENSFLVPDTEINLGFYKNKALKFTLAANQNPYSFYNANELSLYFPEFSYSDTAESFVQENWDGTTESSIPFKGKFDSSKIYSNPDLDTYEFCFYFHYDPSQDEYEWTSRSILKFNWELESNWSPITESTISASIESLNANIQTLEVSTLYEKYPYFENLLNYKGRLFIENKELELKNLIIEWINKRNIAENELTLAAEKRDEAAEESEDYMNYNTQVETLIQKIDDIGVLVGNWNFNINTNQLIERDVYGTLTLKYSKFVEYKEDFYEKLITDKVLSNIEEIDDLYNPIYTQFKEIKKEKNDFWYDLKSTYGQFLNEGYYINEVESDSYNLYVQALKQVKYHENPSEEYSLTYIDSSQIIGKNINLIEVGDFIKIRSEKLGILNGNESNELQVNSISRSLKDLSNMQLTVSSIKKNSSLIEKLLKNISRS